MIPGQSLVLLMKDSRLEKKSLGHVLKEVKW